MNKEQTKQLFVTVSFVLTVYFCALFYNIEHCSASCSSRGIGNKWKIKNILH